MTEQGRSESLDVVRNDEVAAVERGSGARRSGEPPAGINQEWFENVCQACAHLTAAGCSDKITAKFPGKCDPILKYERNKAGVR